MYVIEFQKRGLPHAHILVILEEYYKLNTTDDYDQVISAEIPDTEVFPELYANVARTMSHGPCGVINNET